MQEFTRRPEMALLLLPRRVQIGDSLVLYPFIGMFLLAVVELRIELSEYNGVAVLLSLFVFVLMVGQPV